MSSKLKSLSFFSGCLGLDIGLENVDIENILFCENDKFCKNTQKKTKIKSKNCKKISVKMRKRHKKL